jgi:hypothetical protein
MTPHIAHHFAILSSKQASRLPRPALIVEHLGRFNRILNRTFDPLGLPRI